MAKNFLQVIVTWKAQRATNKMGGGVSTPRLITLKNVRKKNRKSLHQLQFNQRNKCIIVDISLKTIKNIVIP